VRAESGAQGLKFGHFADGRVRLLADPRERAVLSAFSPCQRGELSEVDGGCSTWEVHGTHLRLRAWVLLGS
jgi:hypothetical protein